MKPTIRVFSLKAGKALAIKLNAKSGMKLFNLTASKKNGRMFISPPKRKQLKLSSVNRPSQDNV